MLSQKLYLLAGAMCVGLLVATPANASSCTGTCGTLGADGDVSAPPVGTTYGYVSSYLGPVGAGEIASVGGTNGSEFTTDTFTATANESLNFYFNYITGDGTSAYPDYAFAELEDGVGGHVAYLFTARTVAGAGNTSPGFGLPADDSTLTPATTPINPGATNWSPLGPSSGGCYGGPGFGCGSTGWIESTFSIVDPGTYQLRFGVTNFGDQDVDSGLAFAGVTIGGAPVGGVPGAGGVPEPSQWALLLLGFLCLGSVMRFGHGKSVLTT